MHAAAETEVGHGATNSLWPRSRALSAASGAVLKSVKNPIIWPHPSLKAMALAAGSRLGSYEVTAKIGKGGMGQVYRARDTKLNRPAIQSKRR